MIIYLDFVIVTMANQSQSCLPLNLLKISIDVNSSISNENMDVFFNDAAEGNPENLVM
jgi:hypothetical protein